jgi:hypothetical protein
MLLKEQLQLISLDSEAEQKFRQFHAENPQVYRELVRLAYEAKAAGRTKIGIKMLWEVVRWNRFLATTDRHFKLPNNHHSRYARLIMEQEEDLQDIFHTRGLRS